MKRYIFLVSGVVLILIFITASTLHQKILSSTPSSKPSITHSSHLFDPNFFTQAYSKSREYEKIPTQHVFGGILPHHLLAGPLIAGFFQGIAKQKVSTVILLSPNHYGVSKYPIATSKGVWTTLFGDLPPNTEKIDRLLKDNVVSVSEDLFDNEHGIYGLTPFIKKTFPDATIVPIVIKGGTSQQDCDALAKSLEAVVDDKTIILVSSDFSHYLPSDQADLHDQESIPAIESFATNTIFHIDHVKNMDSPESVYVLLKIMEQKYATNTIFLANTNSAKLTQQPNIQSTTSYLTMYFTQKQYSLADSTIFNYTNPYQASAPNTDPGKYTIIATGDVIPARSVNAQVVQLHNFTYPFEKTVGFLKSADAVFINLESPLLPNCQSTREGMTFCGDSRNVDGLVYAGVTVASIANNHAGNYGLPGINSTIQILKKYNIQPTGDGSPAVIKIRDKTFGFLGYNSIGHQEQGIAWADVDQIKKDIQELKKKVDFVIVTFHWGVEYTLVPTQTQINLAHTAIDAGADVVIGNHPHWVQGIERYKGKFITYAHGNYVFDQMWSQETREGVLGKYTFDKHGLIGVSFLPIIIEDYAQPRFADQKEAENILSRMKQSTQAIMPRNN